MVGAGSAGSFGRHEARSRGPAGPPALEFADERWHEQPRPVLRAAGAPGPARGRVDAGGVRAADRGTTRGRISRIENGKRPPTELFAQMCDRAFPGRDGWFGEFYGRVPHVDRDPAVVPRLGRARASGPATLADLAAPASCPGCCRPRSTPAPSWPVNPGVTEDQVSERLAARPGVVRRSWPGMPPRPAWFLVDEAALRRRTGSADRPWPRSWATWQALARLPNITIQVVPDCRRTPGCSAASRSPSTAAYVETAVAGQVFEDADIIAGLITVFGYAP